MNRITANKPCQQISNMRYKHIITKRVQRDYALKNETLKFMIVFGLP
jgi:hypothetical protein